MSVLMTPINDSVLKEELKVKTFKHEKIISNNIKEDNVSALTNEY